MRKERTYSTGRSTLTLGILLAIIMTQALAGNVGGKARSKIVGPAASAGATVAPQAPLALDGRIAFTSERDGNSEIYTMNTDGSDQVNLTRDGGPDITPDWSFDGRRITFASNRDESWGTFRPTRDIYVMDADGSNLENVTRNETFFDVRYYDPAWSPNGKRIIFVDSFQGELSSLVIINPYEGKFFNSFDWNSEAVAPAWSPDGTRLAFVSRTGTNNIEDPLRFYLHVINVDGSGKTRITLDMPALFSKIDFQGGPTWSPDGTKIAFANYQDSNAEIYQIDASGGNLKRLTNNKAQDLFPSWSPDGTRIAFASNRDGNFEIYSMSAEDGGDLKRLTENDADDYDPVWQPSFDRHAPAPFGPTLQFASPAFRVTENPFRGYGDPIVVTRLGDLRGAASVDYLSSDGTARSGSNYAATSGTLFFAPGEASKTIASMALDNGWIEGDRFFNLTLRNPTGASLGGPVATKITITDNNIPIPGRNALDDPQFFVSQQYRDFLNREPDAPGLAYWTNQITLCKGDPACEHRRRVDVAAAFFISQEFQQSGFFIYGFYQAALGRRPTYNEFTADHKNVRGGPNLEANRQAFANAFVQRQDFLTKYPSSMDGAAFINALLATIQQNSGVDLSGQRGVLTQELDDCIRTGSATQATCRARIVGELLAHPAFVQAEYNRAFILSEYFGYLRREPDEAGYQFWLNVLNNREPGNYRGMVCSFITSVEYQMHFGHDATRSNRNCAQD